MDFAELLNVKALAAGGACAAGSLAGAVFLEFTLGKRESWKRVAAALVPLSLGAGFVVHHAVAFPFPKGTWDRPWYLDEIWKMTVVAGMIAAALVAIARVLPRWADWIPLVVLAMATALICVRGPWVANEAKPAWESWQSFALGIGGCLLAYFACAWPIWRDPRNWGAGIIPLWISLSATAVVFLSTFEQRIGRILVMGAILAGMAGVLAAIPRMRPMAGAAIPFLAALLAAAAGIGAYYDLSPAFAEPPIVPRALYWLACAPLGMGISWLPMLRKKPWACAALASAIALGLAATGTAVAMLNAPPPPPAY
jgi:hypothetical protein